MPRKPARLRHGVDERPPWRVTALLSVQHACMALVFLVYPVAAASAIGLDAAQTAAFLTASIVAMAASAFLHPLRPPFGSGSLILNIPSPVMLPATLQAGLTGGLPMIAGMSLMKGATLLLMARVLRHLRVLFPAEVCGVVILMLGVAIATPALKNATGASFGADGQVLAIDLRHVLVAVGTLVGIVLVTVFGRGPMKLFAVASGLLAGIALSTLAGLFDAAALQRLDAAPWLGLPRLDWALPAFDLSLLPLVLVLTIFNGVDTMGVLIGSQRLVDADWKKIDTAQCAGGIQASGVGDVVAGTLGAMPVAVSSSNLALVFATATASRIIATCTAGVLLAAAFTPKVVAVMMLLPKPVVGAIMAYSAANMVVAGMALVHSRMASDRRTMTVGLAVLAGTLPLVLPGLGSQLSPLVAPILKSPLAIAAVVAIALNLLLRIGIARQAAITLPRSPRALLEAGEFLDRMGRAWGARHDAVARARQAASEVIEMAAALDATGELRLEARFDDMDLDVVVAYEGVALSFPETLDLDGAALEGEQELALFAGFVVRKLADRLQQSSEGDRHRLLLRFEH